MKKPTLLIILILFLHALNVSAQEKKKKLFIAEKIDYDAKSEKEIKETDAELKDEMANFLGFGFRLSITNVDERLNTADKEEKKKTGLRFQVGFQMPRFIKTKPPQKIFKAGMDIGIVR